jgi:hypothetical protein
MKRYQKGWPVHAAVVLLIALAGGWSPIQPAQTGEMRQTAPHVFIDCERWVCDLTYVRSEITFINYMRDRENADIHLMITRRTTGGGGREYTLEFIGLRSYQGKDATLKYFSKSTDSEDQVRKGLVNILKQGLIPYVSDTPLAEFISISYRNRHGVESPPLRDSWNFWVFSVGLRGNLNLEDLYKRYRSSLSLSANRTTREWKFRFWASGNFDERQYTVEDEGETEEIVSRSARKFVYAQLIKSLTDHWSAGLSTSLNSASYDNADLFASFGPAVEYNIFPYEESTRRELRFQYRLSLAHQDYDETTIYGKDDEYLVQQTLQSILEIKEPWGSVGLQLEGESYLHDFSKNNFKIEGGLSMRVFKGLSFNIESEYSLVRDQISLPATGASKDEILLELKRLATSYDFRLEMGFSYRFGSIYNNVVNPRFGNR